MGRKDGPRRLSHSERIVRAIRSARMQFKDDAIFLEEVHKILLRERILKREEFGIHAGEVDNDDNDNDYDE